MRLNETGLPCREDEEKISDGIKLFLRTVHECNPAAYLFWCFGMCSVSLLAPCIRRAVSEYKIEDSDPRVAVVELPSMNLEKENEHGSRCHPGPETHRRASEKLTAAIESVIYGTRQKNGAHGGPLSENVSVSRTGRQ